jgi:hypothetical protein
MGGAGVSSEINGYAALGEYDRERLGRKQMAAGTAGRQQNEFVRRHEED